MKLLRSPALRSLVATALVVAARAAAPEAAVAQHAKVSRADHFTVALPPAAAFVLFEPAGEILWAEGWHPVFASAGDLPLHDGSVFTVQLPHPPSGQVESVWAVSRYEPPALIEYRNVLIGQRATRIRVECAAGADGGTEVTVRYEYTGLTTEGDQLVAQFSAARFQEMIRGWHDAIAAYLAKRPAHAANR